MPKARTAPKDKSTKKAPAPKGPAEKIAGKDQAAAKPASKAASKVSPEKESTASSGVPDTAPSGEAGQGVLENAHLPATHGKVGVFGGPKDRGVKPDDKLALPT